MKKVFLDTNVFLDILFERENLMHSLSVISSCEMGSFIGCVSDITLLNIDYVAKKQGINAKSYIEKINNYFEVIGADNKVFEKALLLQNDDLEDSIQYICAKKYKCNIIVTNDRTFYKGDIRILSSREFDEVSWML